MPPEITPEQKQLLSSWAAERDSILLQNAVLRDEQQALSLNNKNLAASNTELETKINQYQGRIDELKKKELEFVEMVTSDTALKLSQKTRLETEIMGLEKQIPPLVAKKDLLIEMIDSLALVHQHVFSHVQDLDKVVDHVSRVSTQNLRDIEIAVDGLGRTIQTFIDTNDKSIREANHLINKVPEVFFELQRQSLNKHKF